MGYRIAYLVDAEGGSYPEGSNTAVFAVAPGGKTEPVLITQDRARFEIQAQKGKGEAILASVGGGVVKVPIVGQDNNFTIDSGLAYFYRNTSSDDLVFTDKATPAYKEGDDIDISQEESPGSALPPRFWDLLAEDPSPRAVLLRPGEVESFTRPGFTGRVFVSNEEQLGFNAMQIDVRGGHPTKIVCTGNTRCYYVGDGAGVFNINGEDQVVNGGELIVVPAGARYSYSGSMRLFEFNVSPDNSFGDKKIE